MQKLLTICLVLFISFPIMAQNHICGLPGGAEDEILIERLKSNIEYYRSHGSERSQVTRYVPVVFHNIMRADGTGGIAITKIFDQMCKINEFYASENVEIQFYLQEINEIKNNTAYGNHNSASGRNIFNSHKRSKAVNIYVPENANTSNNSVGITLGYYSPSNDWIVLRPAEVSGFSETLDHEMGHFLTLEHPFRGWDFEAYDPAEHGVQVGTFAPSVNFNNLILNEKQDGSNCAQAGDLLCDTPPDYNHIIGSWGCNYTQGTKDPNGDEIDPDETNIMSYFNSCNPKTFSDMQIAMMNSDLSQRVSFGSINLVGNPPAAIGDFNAFVEPVNEESVAGNGAIFFDWEDVDNAEQYVIEIDRFPNFAFMPARFLVDQSEFTFDGSELFLNTQYYWRVKPISSYFHCSSWSGTESFISSALSSTNSIEQVENISLMPNPVSSGSTLNLQLIATQAFDGVFGIININGVKIAEQSQTVRQGVENLIFSTTNLSAGVYFLQVTSANGIIQEKFVVQ